MSDLVSWSGLTSFGFSAIFYLISRDYVNRTKYVEQASPIQSLSDLKGLVKILPKLVAIRGRTFSDDPLKSELCAKKAVITRLTKERSSWKQDLTTGNWKREENNLMKVVDEALWCLEDGSGVRIPVFGAQQASGQFFETAGEVFDQKDDRSTVRKLMDVCMGIRLEGIRTKESILPVGTLLTAVGEIVGVVEGTVRWPNGVIKCDNNKIMAIQTPKDGNMFITTKTLQQLCEGMGTTAKICRMIALGCGVVGVFLFLRKIWKLYSRKRRERRMRRQMEEFLRNHQNQPSAPNLAPGGTSAPAAPNVPHADEVGDGGVCVICMESRCDAVFVPCGHMCCCYACGERMSRRCPVCRSRSTSLVKVYYS
eukprot:TRINITY_DN8889_c0_g1_i1.p2 TRINITY_DN8889_c0_g1~~TRINITY_DN8889_c0_g1_i1.p2  ORF type:complete len:367 (-),score=54.78 TRINITY_DN8889_c0_g1_i1:151-1251(-)